MYPLVGHLLPAAQSFKERFSTEKRRQWEYRKVMSNIQAGFSHIVSSNPNAAGRFLGPYAAKAKDLDILVFNLDSIEKLKIKLKEQEKEIHQHEEKILDERGNVKLRHNKYAHLANEKMLTEMMKQKEPIEDVEKKLRETHDDLLKRVCPHLALKSEARRKKENQKKLRSRKKRALFQKIVMTGLFEEYGIKLVCITLVKLDEVKQLSEKEKATLMLIWERFDETAQSVIRDTLQKCAKVNDVNEISEDSDNDDVADDDDDDDNDNNGHDDDNDDDDDDDDEDW